MIITLVFKKNANFLPKIGKIAEKCDHNIDSWFAKALWHGNYWQDYEVDLSLRQAFNAFSQ
jgi:hypothetical protein